MSKYSILTPPQKNGREACILMNMVLLSSPPSKTFREDCILTNLVLLPLTPPLRIVGWKIILSPPPSTLAKINRKKKKDYTLQFAFIYEEKFQKKLFAPPPHVNVCENYNKLSLSFFI